MQGGGGVYPVVSHPVSHVPLLVVRGGLFAGVNPDTLISAPSPEPAAGDIAHAGKEVSF